MSEPGLPDAVGSVAATRRPGNATLTQQDLDQTMKRAQEMFRRKDYAVAIQLLTRLTEQPEFPQRAQAQELLGLARERNGQLAHAKAEYEEYLRRYPQGEAADRVSQAPARADVRGEPGQRTGACRGRERIALEGLRRHLADLPARHQQLRQRQRFAREPRPRTRS